MDVAAAVVGDMVPRGGGAERDPLGVVDGPGVALGGEADLVHEADAFRVCRAQREHQPGVGVAPRLQAQPADRGARVELDPGAAGQGEAIGAGFGGDAHSGVHVLPLDALGGP